jgi:hypothetical protein
MRQLVGEPIDLRSEGRISVDDRAGLLSLHDRVQRAVQELLDRARGLRRIETSEVSRHDAA